jgi:iron complex transport system substrate-binding protein
MSSRLHGPGFPCWMARTAILILITFPAAGCRQSAIETQSGVPAPGEGARRLSMTDGLGRNFSLEKQPARIVSLAPSVTEVLFLLGVGDRVVGVTSHCDWPDEARRKPRIGTLINPNAEVILAARPDLVIASTAGNDRQAVLRLADLGLPVFVTAPRSIDGIFDTLGQIARLTGAEARGDELRRELAERIGRVKSRVAGRPTVRAFFITWFEPLLVPGRRTFETDVLRLAGIESISAGVDEFYPHYSLEQAVSRDPDVILTVRHEGHPLPDLRATAGWRELRAVRTGRVYLLGEVIQHPSPRFVDGLEELVDLVFPEEAR